MLPTEIKLILWMGQKHCGKTTSVAKLAQLVRDEGFKVAGVLAPSLYHKGKLIGFDVIDLQSEARAPLARRKVDKSDTTSFTFIDAGFELGNAALRPSAANFAEIIIVDEFGPLEVDGGGWRRGVDLLLRSTDALILLVVRQELVEQVQRLYATITCRLLAATESQSVDEVITILRNRRDLKLRSMVGG